jgi:hypothetical protein
MELSYLTWQKKLGVITININCFFWVNIYKVMYVTALWRFQIGARNFKTLELLQFCSSVRFVGPRFDVHGTWNDLTVHPFLCLTEWEKDDARRGIDCPSVSC